MIEFTQKNIIIIIVTTLAIAILMGFYMNKKSNVEYFTSEKKLNDYYVEQSDNDLHGLTIDTALCHPSCCGDTNYVSFDNLTPDELKNRVTDMNSEIGNGPYVRTDYSCANGDGGAGCPCISKKAYLTLANRGQPFRKFEYDTIEPTLSVGAGANKPVKFSPYPSEDEHNSTVSKERDVHSKYVMIDHPKMNDIELQRRPEIL